MNNSTQISKQERNSRAAKKKKQRKTAVKVAVCAAILLIVLVLFRVWFPVGWAKLFGINPLEDNPEFVTIDGFEISGDEFARFALQERDYYINNYGDVSIGLMADKFVNFRDAVMVSVRYNYAFLKWAYDEGITEESVDDDTVSEFIAEVRDYYGGEDEFIKAIAVNYSDEKSFEMITRRNLVISMLEDRIYSGQSILGEVTDADCSDFYDDKNCVTVQQIAIPFDIYDDDDIAEKKALAEQALKEIVSGTPFENVMDKYNTDESGCVAEGNIYYNDGSTPEEFLNKAEELEIGGVSSLFAAGEKLYILKRVDATEAMKADQLRSVIYDNLSSEYLQNITLNQEIKYSKRFKMVDASNLVNPFEDN